MFRFFDIQSGSISIDGQNIAHVSQDSLRQHVSMVPQEPLLFHRSLRQNIAYGAPDISDADIHEAAKKARADMFIGRLEDGYDTLVGER